MNDNNLKTIEEIRAFISYSEGIEFSKLTQEDAYEWAKKTLIGFKYIYQLNKEEKGVIKTYISKITGYSRAQVTRLISQYIKNGDITLSKTKRHSFAKVYSDQEIKLLAEVDELHNNPNGNATKKIIERMHQNFKKKEYKELSSISVSHIYNLRKTPLYKRVNKTYQKTKPTVIRRIGERRKPSPDGKPGFLRVDTVHQGDKGKVKGVYHINAIDEVTQFEFIGSCSYISEHYLEPLLNQILDAFPFMIIEFHSDNGSEYINKTVCKLLNKLLIKLTKSRARKSTDNALIESKNGSIIRKWIGYQFIDKKHSERLNQFYFSYFNEYLNFHRPCAFPKEITNKKGKIKKVYRYCDYMTPYEKLCSLPDFKQYLKPHTSVKILDAISMKMSVNESVTLVQFELNKFWKEIFSE